VTESFIGKQNEHQGIKRYDDCSQLSQISDLTVRSFINAFPRKEIHADEEQDHHEIYDLRGASE
jgi:hypothetical protein